MTSLPAKEELEISGRISENIFGNPLTIYRIPSGHPGPKPRKSLKKVSGKSRESEKRFEKVPRRFFRDFFQSLRGPQGQRPLETFFQTFVGSLGPKGPRDPCKWSTGSQEHFGNFSTFAPFPEGPNIEKSSDCPPGLKFSGVPLRWGSLQCKSKFWARNFKFWARDVHPTISQAQVKTCSARKTNSRSTHPRSNETPEIFERD